MKLKLKLLLAVVLAALVMARGAAADIVGDPDGYVGIGTAGEDVGQRTLCISTGGTTHDCAVGITTTGWSTRNTVSVSGTGPAGTGYCDEALVAASGTGSSCGALAVSGTGPAGMADCPDGLVDVSVSGPTCGWVQVNGIGPVTTDNCSGTLMEVAGTHPTCGAVSVSGTESAGMAECSSSLVAVSGTDASCGTVAVSGTGSASGAVTVTGGNALCPGSVCGVSAIDLAFEVGGTLDPFPGTLQTTSFNGSATGAGSVTGEGNDGFVYHADFQIQTIGVAGYVLYNEPAWPVCPLAGSAVPLGGHVDIASDAVSGVVNHVGDTELGPVTGVSTSFDFQYNRVGATATLVITGGSFTTTFVVPGRGRRTMTTTYAGTGAGVFQVDPVQAEANCRAGGGSLPYVLTGDAVLAG